RHVELHPGRGRDLALVVEGRTDRCGAVLPGDRPRALLRPGVARPEDGGSIGGAVGDVEAELGAPHGSADPAHREAEIARLAGVDAELGGTAVVGGRV